jgi:hypothetical protein
VNLLRAELSRLAARRFIQIMVVVLLGAFAITAATTLAASDRPSASELARAAHAADLARHQELDYYRECQRARLPGTPEQVRGQFPRECREPDLDSIRSENYVQGAFVFAGEIRGLLFFLTAFLTLFGFLIGASFVGAELASGGMVNLLLWETRRLRVLGAKLAAVLAAVGVSAVVATVLYIGVFRLIAAFAGLAGRIDGALWGSVALTAGRGLVTTLVATAGGFAIATLGRHTAAALGVVAAYTVVWEGGARVVMTIVDAPADAWMLSSYLAAWMDGALDVSSRCGTDFCVDEITWVNAAVVFAVLLAGLLGAAFHTFRQRDLV